MPARQTFVSELVGPERLPNAIGLNSATFHAARIVGPAVAGFVIAWFGTGWAILSNAVTYLAFIAGLHPARRRPAANRPGHRARQAPDPRRGGLRRGPTRTILLVLCVVFVVGTFGMNFQLTSALMAQQEFGLGAEAVRTARHVHGRRIAGRRTRRRPARPSSARALLVV